MGKQYRIIKNTPPKGFSYYTIEYKYKNSARWIIHNHSVNEYYGLCSNFTFLRGAMKELERLKLKDKPVGKVVVDLDKNSVMEAFCQGIIFGGAWVFALGIIILVGLGKF